jgi:16S rRNA (guanine966-N2)-methyltransferase
MRIIAGTKRGMRLFSPKGYETTRPITDRVKESLFSVLYKYNVIDGGIVADLFCGTGSLGLEALSRGAKWVSFIEKDRKVAEILNRNIAKADFVAQSKVICANAFKVGAPGGGGQEKCDLVFVDPPYSMSYDVGQDSQTGGLLKLLCEQITERAVVVVRTHEKVNLESRYEQLRVIDRRNWGSMAVTIFGLSEKDDES